MAQLVGMATTFGILRDFRGLIVALGIGFAEELLFRAGCWMNCSGYQPRVALWVDALHMLCTLLSRQQILRTCPALCFCWD